jgi:hypothetical protein
MTTKINARNVELRRVGSKGDGPITYDLTVSFSISSELGHHSVSIQVDKAESIDLGVQKALSMLHNWAFLIQQAIESRLQ